MASTSAENNAEGSPAAGGATGTVDTARTAAGAATMVEAFDLTVAALNDRVAIRTKGDEVTLTWAQWRERAT